MHLRIISVRWFCEVPAIYVLRTPPPSPLKRKEEDKYLNFMTYVSFFFSSDFFSRFTVSNILSGTYIYNC